MLKRIQLGSEALAFVRSSLETNSSFSSCLLRLPLEGGVIHTELPPGVSPSVLTAFDAGGIASANETEDTLISLICRHLTGLNGALVIVESFARPGDPFLNRAEERYFAYHTEVYFYLRSSEATERDIRATLRHARHYPFVCALTSSLNTKLLSQQAAQVPLGFIEDLASRTQHITVGAYDEEAYLIWTATRRS